jgi:hypothetical protein
MGYPNSQIALAFGQRGADFTTAIPSLLTDSSRCVAKMLSRSCSRYWYRSSEADRFAQLLQGPTGARMCAEVAMYEATTAVLDDNEYVEQPESCGHDDQEITGDDSPGRAAAEMSTRASHL